MDQNGLAPEEKLKLLQRLDGFRSWQSTHDRRLCLGCGKLISGTEIKLGHGLGGLGLPQLQCPTEDCRAGPMEWVYPDGRA
ncbi:MAG TPA: hypothetical protein VE086_09370 [Chthoniobacterales bacterium]|nr:hypothetical protein [Chthoniobacterales bacterium]